MVTGLHKLTPGSEEHKKWIEDYNKMMDDLVEWRKHGWNKERAHAEAKEYKELLEGVEAFMEKKGTPLPKHSHRFAPEALYPKASTDDENAAPVERDKS